MPPSSRFEREGSLDRFRILNPALSASTRSAHILARQHGSPNVDAVLAVQAAELGLANAVLGRRPGQPRCGARGAVDRCFRTVNFDVGVTVGQAVPAPANIPTV